MAMRMVLDGDCTFDNWRETKALTRCSPQEARDADAHRAHGNVRQLRPLVRR